MRAIFKAFLVDLRHGESARVPEPYRLVWRWFLDLDKTRTFHAVGLNPISYAEIESYARLYRWPLEPRHIDMIMALDKVWLEVSRSSGAKRGDLFKSAPPPEMNAASFDAVFS